MKKLYASLIALWFITTLAGCNKTGVLNSDTPETTPTTVETATETANTESEATALDGYSSYSNADYAFTLQYPSDWEYQENTFGSHIMIFSPSASDDTFRENIGVITEELPADLELDVDSYYNEAKSQLTSVIENFKEVSNENIKVAGYDAKKVQYLGTQGEDTYKWQQVFFIKDNMTYVITYTATEDTFEDFLDVANSIVASFGLSS